MTNKSNCLVCGHETYALKNGSLYCSNCSYSWNPAEKNKTIRPLPNKVKESPKKSDDDLID